ncbi:MAG TPA: ABC transporter ATP-binding protein [Actinomycetota bacterium]|nr:ABC transporter ATP-binding protein [Actinomycetota bacterium]
MIEARGLSKSFGGRAAIDDVSFRVEVGEIVGFLGPNGAGKSTTMRILLGTLRADAGEATVDGPTGYLPESFAAYDALSVRSYLRFIAKLKNVRDDQAVDRAMDRSGVADLASRPVERLSKGQRQRVGMAQALLGSPRAYILDEPTIGLDPAQIVEARRVIAGLREGAAVLLSTHVLSEAAEVCDRVVVIVRGRVVSEERPGSTPDLEDRFMRLVGEAELEQ